MSEIEANAVLGENEVPTPIDDTSISVGASDATEVLLASIKKENVVKMDSGEQKRNVDTNIKPEMAASTAEVDKKVEKNLVFDNATFEMLLKKIAETTSFTNNLEKPNAAAIKTDKPNLALSGTTETADKMPGAPNTRAANLGFRTQSIRRYLSLLIHACHCNGIHCLSTSCEKMKRIIQHTRICKGRSCICTTCKQVITLCWYHAKGCKEKTCSVPFCENVKSKLRQHQLQKSAQQQLNGVVPSLSGMATSAIISVIDAEGAIVDDKPTKIVGEKSSAATVMDGSLTVNGKESDVKSGKTVNVPIVDGKEPIADGKGPIVDGKGPIVVGKGPIVDGKGPIVVGKGPIANGKVAVIVGKGLITDDNRLISTGKGLISDGKIRIINGESYEDIEKLIVEGKIPENAIVVDEVFIETEASIIYGKNVDEVPFFGTKEGEPELKVADSESND